MQLDTTIQVTICRNRVRKFQNIFKVQRRPEITILQLTLLFLICNLSSTAVYLYYFVPSGSGNRRTDAHDARIMYVCANLFHVLNAALSPLIMILRGRSLKKCIRREISSLRVKFASRTSSVTTVCVTPGMKATVYKY